uniref:Uncharacterized protein n=1 Tax=Tanacetum cinerariifolium TaxID=118510 RepID=A0A6L2JS81_TANCI|nr:hypothetical protein [Tanacetum cinerariifolium]
MPPRMRTRSASRPATESLRGGMGVWVGRGGRGERLRKGNDERVNDLSGQGNDQGKDTAFWFLRFISCDLVLQFGHAFCFKTSCVLPKEKLRFVLKQVAFCFKALCVLLQDSLHFASKLVAFCFKTRCILLHDILRFVSRFL